MHDPNEDDTLRMCCPRCGNEIGYDEEDDDWFCPECDVLVDIWSQDVSCPAIQARDQGQTA